MKCYQQLCVGFTEARKINRLLTGRKVDGEFTDQVCVVKSVSLRNGIEIQIHLQGRKYDALPYVFGVVCENGEVVYRTETSPVFFGHWTITYAGVEYNLEVRAVPQTRQERAEVSYENYKLAWLLERGFSLSAIYDAINAWYLNGSTYRTFDERYLQSVGICQRGIWDDFETFKRKFHIQDTEEGVCIPNVYCNCADKFRGTSWYTNAINRLDWMLEKGLNLDDIFFAGNLWGMDTDYTGDFDETALRSYGLGPYIDSLWPSVKGLQEETSLPEPEGYAYRHCRFCDNEVENDDEALWGHIQLGHPEVFEECQDWETPYMLEEYYGELYIQDDQDPMQALYRP